MDPKPVTRIVPDIVGHPDPAAAHEVVCTPSANRNEWLPEALMLFNTPGLTPPQRGEMAASVFAHGPSMAEQNREQLAGLNARLGRYGFSFPLWRFPAQAFNGASLLERFGMKKLKRETDLIDATLPDPARDLFGTGYVLTQGNIYIEYRRAYILCADMSDKNPAAIVIRNNSYFFGRDRLPDPVFVSLEKFTADELVALSPDSFLPGGRFQKWQDISAENLEEKIHRCENLMAALDDFDMKMNLWLRNDPAGFAQLLSFLQSKLAEGKPGLPFLAEIDADMPPWFPRFSLPITPALLTQLETGAPAEGRLKSLFGAAAGKSTKLALLSGERGDPPLKPAPTPQGKPDLK